MVVVEIGFVVPLSQAENLMERIQTRLSQDPHWKMQDVETELGEQGEDEFYLYDRARDSWHQDTLPAQVIYIKYLTDENSLMNAMENVAYYIKEAIGGHTNMDLKNIDDHFEMINLSRA